MGHVQQAKYDAFVKWLVYQAPDHYAESDADVGYATLDAVMIATVHQAKGMQWPAVFVPALRWNRFSSPRQCGVSVFHLIPEAAVPDVDRYRGTVADETRLSSMAVTRAQEYLHLSFSPGEGTRYLDADDLVDKHLNTPSRSTAGST